MRKWEERLGYGVKTPDLGRSRVTHREEWQEATAIVWPVEWTTAEICQAG